MHGWVNITALHTARKAFTEAESSERIRRALRRQLRPTDEKYETGDKVFYKRTDCVEWKGPGVVIGQDGVVIFVRHGGTYVRVHHTRLRKANDVQSEVTDAGGPEPPLEITCPLLIVIWTMTMMFTMMQGML